MYYIYELWDPRNNQPFYVGKGTGSRASRHTNSLKETDFSLKANIIRQILAEGFTPIVKKVFFTSDETEAYDKEKQLIACYGKRINGTGILSNIQDGGEGGNTVKNLDPAQVKERYKKRNQTLATRSEDSKKSQYKRISEQNKKHWQQNYEDRCMKIKEGIRKNRNKKRHSQAVSEGWRKRSKEDKKLTSSLKSKLRSELWKNADKIQKERLLAGSKVVSQPVKIITNTGEEFFAQSLLKWCKEHNESYSALWIIKKGKILKPNKYKVSKYLGWKVIVLNEK